jgi:hypothetical protein
MNESVRSDSTPGAGSERKPRRRRLLWILVGGFLTVVVVAGVALPFLLDVERYRGHIEEALASATGWETELGAIDFSLWQGMVLTVGPASLRAPGDSSGFEIESLEIRAGLWSLFRGELNVETIALVRPEITLVRHDEEQGWVLPVPSETDTSSDSEEETDTDGSRSVDFEVNVDQIRVRDGRLRVDDRAGDPPLVLELTDLDITVSGDASDIVGSGELADGGGRLEWRGNLEEGLTLTLDGLRTERLHQFLGPDLIKEGGELSGEIRVGLPLEIRGDLTGRGVTLMAGEKPFDSVQVGFLITTEGENWLLDDLNVDADGVKLTGRGSLMPSLALDVELPPSPLEATLRASESVLPLPLDVRPPGTVEARLRVEQPEGGELTYTANGTLSAAEFVVSEMLPPTRDVEAAFDLNREGALEVRLVDGVVGGGPAKGVARLSSIDPPGALSFDGGLQDAILGALLQGFLGDSAQTITGPTGLNAALALDLGRDEIDARALSGRLDLESQQVSLPGWDLEGAIRRKIEERLEGLDLSSLVERKLSGDKKKSRSEGGVETTRVLDNLAVSVDFDSWPWKLEELAIQADGLTASGDGTFDPIAGSVDVDFTAWLDEVKTTELVRKTDELKVLVDNRGRLTLPLRIRGSMLSPSIGVDLGKAFSASLGDDEKKEAVKGLLKGLLGRDKN